MDWLTNQFRANSPPIKAVGTKETFPKFPEWHEDIVRSDWLDKRIQELVIDPIKMQCFRIRAQGLDHFLTRHHFFNKAVLNPQVLLLGPK